MPFEAHPNLVLDIRPKWPMHDTEATEHVLPSNRFRVVMQMRKLKKQAVIWNYIESIRDAVSAIDTIDT
jgi:hypothetical protein